jgi:membrane protease YdiL (CAAX protease family)
MQLLNLTVRQDWQELDWHKTTQYRKLWRLVQITILLASIVSVFLAFLPLAWPVGIVLRISFTFSLFVAFSVWTVYHERSNSLRVPIFIYTIFVCAAIIAGFTSGGPAVFQPGEYFSPWPVGFILFVPVIGWLALSWSWAQFPTQYKRLGLHLDKWLINLFTGLATGGSLGFHFLLSTYLLSGFSNPDIQNGSMLLWTLCFRIGLGALGEELLLRGVCFPFLYERTSHNLWKTAVQITLLNFLIYLAPVMLTSGVFWAAWMSVYLIVFSFIVTFLRHRQGSLISCIACNVTFNVIISMVVKW